MTSLRLELRVKNAVLWNAIHEHAGNVAQFCRQFGVPSRQSTIGEYLSLQSSPYGRSGRATRTAAWLSDVLGIGVGELFPPELYAHVPPRVFVAEVPADRLVSLSAVKALPAPELLHAAIERDEMRALVMSALGKLSEREAAVVSMRFGLNDEDEATLSECADALGVSRTRVSQLQESAMNKLRRSRTLQRCVE